MGWIMAGKENTNKDCRSFLALLSEMDESKESTRTLSGFIEGPFSTRAAFSCVVRMGLE
jgi:hypothetical protein